MFKHYFQKVIVLSATLFLVAMFLFFVPPIPTGQARFRPAAIQLDKEKPSYARCTHHAGLNPAVFAYSSAIIWETENDYLDVRTQFLEDRNYHPNLARSDPAWSDYDLLKRSPFSLSTLGVEFMNAATLNYRYIAKDAQQVVTSRTLAVCIDSKRVRSTQAAMHTIFNGGRAEFDD
ncbi:MAG: hypothetical protein AB8G95_23385 [Anaerolineae bacterium]